MSVLVRLLPWIILERPLTDFCVRFDLDGFRPSIDSYQGGMGTPTPGVTPPDAVVGLQQQQHNERNDLSYNQVRGRRSADDFSLPPLSIFNPFVCLDSKMGGGMGQQGFNGVNQYGMMQTRGSNGGNFGPVMNNGMTGMPVMNNMAAGNNPGAGAGMMMNNGAPMAGFQQNGMNKIASMQASSLIQFHINRIWPLIY